MAIRSRIFHDGKVGLIEIKGSFTGYDITGEFRDAVRDLIEQGIKRLVIDLSRVTYLNSFGIGALISAYTSYSRNGGSVFLVGLTKSIQNLFVITKLIDVFEVYDSVEEAISNFK